MSDTAGESHTQREKECEREKEGVHYCDSWRASDKWNVNCLNFFSIIFVFTTDKCAAIKVLKVLVFVSWKNY